MKPKPPQITEDRVQQLFADCVASMKLDTVAGEHSFKFYPERLEAMKHHVVNFLSQMPARFFTEEGDVLPNAINTDENTQWATSFFVVLGLFAMGSALGLVKGPGDKLIDAQKDRFRIEL